MSIESPFLTFKEACEYLRITRATLDRFIVNGLISPIQYTPNGKRLFTKEMLDTFALENIR